MSGESPSRTPVLSDFESSALVVVAAEAQIRPASSPSPRSEESEEQKRQREENERKRKEEVEARRKEALDKFTAAVNERLAKAYEAGENTAVEQADRSNYNARSITLYLVVLAVVAMPVIAMIIKLNPQAFGSYIAPVTGIAGTVVGYWFGALSRSSKSNDSIQ
jgi:hypothetical protein